MAILPSKIPTGELPPPTPPAGQSGLSPEMLRLAESVKKFRSAYTSRPRQSEGSMRAVADLFPVADKLLGRLSDEIRKDPDYAASRSGSPDSTEAQRGKAKMYDKLLRDVMEIRNRAITARQELAAMPSVAEGSEEMTVEANRPDTRPEFMREGRRIRQETDEEGGLSDEEMMKRFGRPEEAAKVAPQTSQAVPPEQVDPLGESQQPDELGESPQPELKEEPGESLPAELAPRTSEEGMPPTSGEMTPAEEAKMDADAKAAENRTDAVAEDADEGLPNWIKELTDDDETLNAFEAAQRARRAAIEKAMARRNLGESEQPELEEEFGESEVPERLEEDRLGESQQEPDLRESQQEMSEPDLGESEQEPDLRESEQEIEEFKESQQDMEEFPESPQGMSEEEMMAGSGIVSTPEARRAAVEKAMRPRQSRAPEGSRIIKGDGGWSYAVLPNKDIKVISAPKGHRAGALLKAGSEGYWTAIADKFGIDTTPEVSLKGMEMESESTPTTKIQIETNEPIVPKTSKTPKKGTRKKGIGQALNKLLTEGIDMTGTPEI